MIFGYLILFISVTISAIAAYYSVVGLTAIFAAAVVPVMIMGGALEAGKIAATVWLHNNWRRAGYAFKLYLVPAIVFLMLLTSMGIFGFLSKAHGDQSLVSGDAMAKVAIFDEKIKISKDNIDANRKALKQMDEAVDQVMGRSSDEKGADKAVAVRRSQQKERARLQSEIQAEQKTITALSEESAPLRAEFRKVEAEVGPIKYIAALIYGDEASQNMLEAAVRWVIILIVVVFDPLALCLILAASKQLEWARHGEGGWVHDEDDEKEEKRSFEALVNLFKRNKTVEQPPVEEPLPAPPEPVDLGVCPHCTTPIVEAPDVGIICPNPDCDVTNNVQEAREQKELEDHMWRTKMIAKALDSDEDKRVTQQGNDAIAEIEPIEPDVDAILEDLEQVRKEEARLKQEREEQQEFLNSLTSEFESLNTQLTEAKEVEQDLRSKMVLAADTIQDNLDSLRGIQSQLDTTTNELALTQAERTQLASDKATLEVDNRQLRQWMDQLENDLREAIALASAKTQELADLKAAQAEPKFLTVGDVERPGDYITPPTISEPTAEELEPPVLRDDKTTVQYQGKVFQKDAFTTLYPSMDIVADNDEIEGTETQASFGTEFPKNQKKGDMFLRVDYFPERLFKWNGVKWIEIDKDQTDRYAFDEAYIKLLVEKLQRGEYDLDDLNDTERAQVAEFLKHNDAQ